MKKEVKKILFFCAGSYVYGKEKAMLSIMTGLKDSGYAIHCIASGYNDGKWVQMLRNNAIAYITVKLGKFSKSLRLLHIKWSLDALIHLPYALYIIHKTIKNQKPDLLFFDSHVTAATILFFLNPNIPVVVRHGELPRNDMYLNHLRSKPYNIKHIANTQFGHRKLEELTLDPKHIFCIYNGFNPVNHLDKVINRPSIVIGCIGQIGEWKGQEDLIEALGILADTGTSFHCLIAGTGDHQYVSFLKDKADQLGIGQFVEFIGYISQIEQFYSNIDICVVPSRFDEPFGNVAAEAGLYGLPCIVTDRGGLPEVVEHGQTGYIVPAHSPKQIYTYLETLINDPIGRRAMGKEAQKYILKEFSIVKMIDNYKNHLDTFNS